MRPGVYVDFNPCPRPASPVRLSEGHWRYRYTLLVREAEDRWSTKGTVYGYGPVWRPA